MSDQIGADDSSDAADRALDKIIPLINEAAAKADGPDAAFEILFDIAVGIFAGLSKATMAAKGEDADKVPAPDVVIALVDEVAEGLRAAFRTAGPAAPRLN